MRRQLKLQGQLGEPFPRKDNAEDTTTDKPNKSLLEQESSDSEHWERRQEKGSYPWTKVPRSAVVTTPIQGMIQGPAGEWEGMEGPSPEEFRCCSIAKLRAKAREHEAEIHSTVARSGGGETSALQTQTQNTDDRESN